jgi:hypothetical protein
MISETQSPEPLVRAVMEGPAMRRVLGEIAQALQGLQFGDVTVLIQNGGVVRIERNEKTRLFRARP